MYAMRRLFGFLHPLPRVAPRISLRFAVDITGDRFQNRDEQPGICALRDKGIRKSCRAHGVLAAADPRFGK